MTSGNKTLYIWVKDAAGNISSPLSANVTISIPVNGACGGANGTMDTSIPTTNLCSTGTSSAVTGTGPWNWSCTGLNGGTTASCSASLAVCSPGPSGMISWWPGDGNADDISGNNNNGTVYGNLTYQGGMAGLAFSLDGNSATRVVSPNNFQNGPSGNFTMTFWAKPNATRASTIEATSGVSGTSQRYVIIPNQGATSSTAGAGVSVGTNGISVFEHGSYYLPSLLVYDTTISDWAHIAVVYQNNRPSLYVNGVMVRQGLTSTRTVYPSNQIGDGNTGYGSYSGLLDEVQIFNRVLSSTEIQNIYTSGAGGICKPVTGTCGSSNGSTLTSVPSTTLCATGTPTTLTGSGPWTWSCTGINGGTTAACSAAVQTNTITFQNGVNGTLTGTTSQTVNYGASATAVTAVPAPGYNFVNWTGTGGFVTTTANPLTVTNVTAAQTITANFSSAPINGACGTANATIVNTVPATNLCSAGSASTVNWSSILSWNCAGANGGTTAACSAIYDTTAPALTVSTLSSGSATNQTPLNISGNVTDANGIASLTINGTAVTVSGSGAYSYALPLTTQGNIAINIVATDKAGNSTTDSRTITYDSTLPVITVSGPADNSQTKDALVTITGSVSKSATVKARIGTGAWQSAIMTGTSFSAQLSLVSGLNTIEVTATDLANNTAVSVKRSVLYDPLSPALAITAPGHDIQINTTAVTVSGTVSDVTATTVNLNFNNTNYPQTVTSGQFSQALTIPAEGSYPVTVTATDAVGNPPATVTRNIIYTPYPGDTNGDGFTTNVVEVMKAFLYVYGNGTLTSTEKLRLDCAPLGPDGKPNPNGIIDAGDVILLLRRTVGLVSW